MFEQFLQERVYLKGISSETQRYYKWVRVAFSSILDHPTKAGALECIQRLRDKGVKPISINSYLCGFNAYCMWLHKEHGKELVKIPRLKEEQKILNTFSAEHIKRIINWKPVGRNQSRAHILALVALDTGLRINELLSLMRQDVDFDNFILLVHGKGNKQRLVPMSIELRKLLYRYLSNHKHARVFCTRTGTPVSVRNSERDFKVMCEQAGITGVRTSWHTLRHSFAVNYLRAGGNLYYLQRILGHSSITTTERYLRSLGIEDLQKVHDRLSLLSKQ